MIWYKLEILNQEILLNKLIRLNSCSYYLIKIGIEIWAELIIQQKNNHIEIKN